MHESNFSQAFPVLHPERPQALFVRLEAVDLDVKVCDVADRSLQ